MKEWKKRSPRNRIFVDALIEKYMGTWDGLEQVVARIGGPLELSSIVKMPYEQQKTLEVKVESNFLHQNRVLIQTQRNNTTTWGKERPSGEWSMRRMG